MFRATRSSSRTVAPNTATCAAIALFVRDALAASTATATPHRNRRTRDRHATIATPRSPRHDRHTATATPRSPRQAAIAIRHATPRRDRRR
jgi:hypothetical protein